MILVATFVGDVVELKAAYDRADALIMQRGGPVPLGELRHHCATSDDALYIVGVWESAEHIRQRWASDEMRALLEGEASRPNQQSERSWTSTRSSRRCRSQAARPAAVASSHSEP